MVHDLRDNFASFFSKLNPSSSFTVAAALEHQTIKKVLEDHCVLTPTCFLQGSYREYTAIQTINDIDIIALCSLWQPGSGSGSSWSRDQIFAAVAGPLLERTRYREKVRYSPQSMCIKVDLGIRIEILPVVFAAGNSDPAREPFRIFRPAFGQWCDGYAREHQARLSKKNASCNGNFIPAIKILKHLRSRAELSTVSFHIESLLYGIPDHLYLGAPCEYIPALLNYLGALTNAPAMRQQIRTPCGDRLLFTSTEWDEPRWVEFCFALGFWMNWANEAAAAPTREHAIAHWKMLLGDDYFRSRPAPK